MIPCRRIAAPALAALALALALLAAAPAASGQATAHDPAPPSIRAQAAILVEPATGDVVFGRNARQQRAIASTTKLMTALLTLERAKLGDVVTVAPYHAAPAESVMGLRTGERMTIADLLRGLLLASANDAAHTLAVRVDDSRESFVRAMNERARDLGLSARFANPIGLDAPGNHASAEDLVKLALVLRRNEFFRRVTDRPSATLRSGAVRRTIVNRNLLVRRAREVNGVKTGHTIAAGYVLVGSATRAGVTVLSVVLGEPSEAARDADTLALLRYGLRSYRVATAVRRGRTYARVPLAHRDEEVELVADRDVRRTIGRGERFDVRVVGVPRELDGPLLAHTEIATLEVRWRGDVIARVALVTRDRVEAVGVVARTVRAVGGPWVVGALALLALGSLQVVVLRRRARRRSRPEQADRTGIA